MSDSGVKPRLVIIVFALACASVTLSTVLLVSQLLAPRPVPVSVTGPDPVLSVEKAIHERDWAVAWSRLVELSGAQGAVLSPRGIALVWELWQADPRAPSLNEVASRRFAGQAPFDERVMLSYLLLQAGLGRRAAELTSPGEFRERFPALDAEISLNRHPDAPVSFAAVAALDADGDTRIALDRALACGYLGDFKGALDEAARVIRLTDPPGVNGPGMIDVARGLCRRQAARIIQIMGLWDSGERSGLPLMKTAASELLLDPDGLVRVAPAYFDLVCDAVAWLGMKQELLGLYGTADRRRHVLGDRQAETRALVSGRPEVRPPSYPDLRSVLAQPESSDVRAGIVDIQDAAWKHNDERGFRLLAWYLWKNKDVRGLRALLEKNRINRGPWYEFYAGLLDEKAGLLTEGREALGAAARGGLEASALLNQSRIRFREGQVEMAANLADEALAAVETRSLGLQEIPGTAYAAQLADALALRSRLFASQGREGEAQALLKRLSGLDPRHPALYHAKGMAVSPEDGMEKTRDPIEE